ncbi:hypothetical protein GGF38_000552, partial [Coemansia sp. RSA 25]
MLNGRRHPQAMDSLLQPQPMPELAAGYDDDAEGKQHWDEMLDKGFDFSQDIEFGDGTAVRINNSRARPKLSPLKPTANAVVEPQTVSSPAISDIAAQPATGARKDPAATGVSKDPVPAPPADNASSEPPPASPPATAELLPTPRRVVETSWGKPAKPTAEASGEGAAAPASARWWKASLSGGSTPRPPPPPPQQQQQQQSSQIQAQAQAVGGRSNASANVRVELSDGNSSGGQAQRGGRGDRGAARAPTSSTGAGKDRPDHRSAGKLSAAATAASWRADPSRGAKPAAEASSQAPLGGAGAAGRQRAQTQGAQMQGSQTQGSQAQGSQAPGAAAGQLDGILNVGPAALPSSSMLPQAMLADILGAAKPALAPIQSSGRLGAAAAAAAYGGGAPGASASLFNVEGSPLMGSSNSPYGAPVRPAVFGHADPGLYTWQGSHVGFHDAPPPPPRELAATRWGGGGGGSSAGDFAQQPHQPIQQQPIQQQPIQQQPIQQQALPPPLGASSGVSFSSFAAGAGMLWMDPSHVAYDAEGRSFRAPLESRPSSHGDSASASASASGSGSAASGATGGPRGCKAPGRTPRPIGTRNTRSRQGTAASAAQQQQQQQAYVHGAPSPVAGGGGGGGQHHPLFVPATHMHQSWLPHYSLMQPPAYGSAAPAPGAPRFGHSPQMTAAPQAAGSGAAPAASAQGAGAQYMVPMAHHMAFMPMYIPSADHNSPIASNGSNPAYYYGQQPHMIRDISLVILRVICQRLSNRDIRVTRLSSNSR